MRRCTTAQRLAVLAVAGALVSGSAAGWWLAAAGGPGFARSLTSSPPAGTADGQGADPDWSANADLIACKAQAESLAVAGRLPEAHAAYRTLAARTVGREFRGRLTWDLAERAKSEQDRIYWILLANTRGADLAFFRGKPTTATPPPGVLPSGRRAVGGAGASTTSPIEADGRPSP